MAEDAVIRTFAGSHPAIEKAIRLIIASPVHLAREGLAATLRDCTDVIVVDAIDLDPTGSAKLADAQPDVVLVDLSQTDPAAAARMIKAVSRGTRLVAFASTRPMTMSLPAPRPASAATSPAKAAPSSCGAPWWMR